MKSSCVLVFVAASILALAAGCGSGETSYPKAPPESGSGFDSSALAGRHFAGTMLWAPSDKMKDRSKRILVARMMSRTWLVFSRDGSRFVRVDCSDGDPNGLSGEGRMSSVPDTLYFAGESRALADDKEALCALQGAQADDRIVLAPAGCECKGTRVTDEPDGRAIWMLMGGAFSPVERSARDSVLNLNSLKNCVYCGWLLRSGLDKGSFPPSMLLLCFPENGKPRAVICDTEAWPEGRRPGNPSTGELDRIKLSYVGVADIARVEAEQDANGLAAIGLSEMQGLDAQLKLAATPKLGVSVLLAEGNFSGAPVIGLLYRLLEEPGTDSGAEVLTNASTEDVRRSITAGFRALQEKLSINEGHYFEQLPIPRSGDDNAK